ncbi:hypothetical protein AX769_15820 [Frondihabitans sp. PAMC 28766]|uniref:hypothetical protein n=1 Tax=Frondihabitans sp. PAMC 28766 TaxID=1795630 RepID=UPI00078BB850|nr:hypothetical protein [Frondihabitans sp. PAMC 28766]AMM21329.1 hypothetical protein AX769_15820 [Frondihabitans sp. PAMC 28766]
MSDDDRISYLALENGTRVLTASGTEIGTVEHVLQDSDLDLFDGIVVKTGDGLRFIDSDKVGTITVGAVHSTVTDDEVAALQAPSGSGVFEADPEEYQGNGLGAWFGRMFLREHWVHDRNE